MKVMVPGKNEPLKIPSGARMTPTLMVSEVKKAVGSAKYSGVSIGYPGPVIGNKPLLEPHNLAPGWVGFDYPAAFPCPVKIINDAAMQALGSYEGGRMLFLGLGTGLGSALIIDGILEPMELAHLPFKSGRTFEDFVGLRGLERLGKKKWRRNVLSAVAQLKAALLPDYIVLGGGNAKYLKELPPGSKLGANGNAIEGGFRLWDPKIGGVA